jgi:signal transduction histidine kinase
MWLFNRMTQLDADLKTLRDTIRIFALAIGFGFIVALAILPVAALTPGLVIGENSFNQRWSGHTLNVVVLMPLILVWRKLPRDWAQPERALEVLLILGATFLVGQVVFLDWFHDSLGQIARGYWLYLFITWTAVRLGTHGTVLVVALVALQGLAGAALGVGFFSNDLEKTHLANYFFYTMTLAAVGLPLATYFTERQLASKALEHHRNMLEATVTKRTAELATRLEEMSVLNKKLEDVHIQLLQSEKMASLGQLAAGVAHEINNPIGFVHSNLGVLETRIADIFEVIDALDRTSTRGATAQEADAIHQLKADKEFDYLRTDIPALLAESKDGLIRVKDIVQNLKDFSRVGESNWEWTDIHHRLDSTLKILANELKYKCTLVKHYAPDLPHARYFRVPDIVENTGKLLDEIVPSIQKTSELVQEIAAASAEQSESVMQIGGAMGQLSKATQQNASASEELAATSEELSGQAEQLQQSIAFFKTGDNAPKVSSRQIGRQPASLWERRAAGVPRLAGSGSSGGNFKPY